MKEVITYIMATCGILSIIIWLILVWRYAQNKHNRDDCGIDCWEYGCWDCDKCAFNELKEGKR